MAIYVENLRAVVHVRTPARASVADVSERRDRKERSPQMELRRPPKPHEATNQTALAGQLAEEPEIAAWAAEDVNPSELAARVYEFMRYDARVARERGGG